MTTPSPHDPIQDSIYIGKVLTAMGARVSSELVAFSGWLLIGFAAILGVLFSNLDAVTTFVAPQALSTVVKLFVLAVVCNVLQRYSAAVVAASVAGGKEIEAYPAPATLDLRSFLTQVESATLWPMRYMVRRSNLKILQGDLAVGGRLISKLAQVEAWLVFVQLIAVVAATWVLANALRG